MPRSRGRRRHGKTRRRRGRTTQPVTGTTALTPTAARRRRILGRLLLSVGIVVFALNLVLEFAPDLPLLPGGHSELYFLGAVAGSIAGAWYAFDLGLRERRSRSPRRHSRG